MNLLPPNRRRNFIPGGMPRIDWTNPITAGLFACYVPAATGGKNINNIVGCGLNLKGEASSSWNNIQEGTALNSFAATSGADVQGIPTILRPSSQSSVFWRGSFDGSQAGTNVPLIAISYANPEADPFFVFGIVNGANAANAVCTYWNTGSVGSTGNGTNISLPTTNKITSIAGTFKIGENARLYYDGIIKDTVAISAGSGAFLYSSTSNVCLGNYLPNLSRICHCSTLIGMMWNRQLSPAEVASISRDPYQFLIYPEDDIFNLMLRNLYTIAPTAGTYAVTGKNATLAAQRKIAPAQGTYALTGISAILAAQRRIAPTAGTYAVTGVAALLSSQRHIYPGAGSYVLSGQAAVLAAGRKLAPAAGSYILTGEAAALVTARKAYPGAGAYALSGQNAQLARGLKISAEGGSYALSGVNAILAVGHKIAPSSGAYSLTGQAAILAAAREMYPGAAVYALSGKDSILRVGRKLIPATGAYLIDGMDATFFVTTAALQPAPGVYGVTGFDVTFTVRRAKSKLILISGFLNDAEIEAVLRS